MGSFYTNVTLKGADSQAVLAELRGRRAFVATSGADIVVFDEACEEQDPALLDALVAGLSAAVGCSALAVLNHDDSVLVLLAYNRGRGVMAYNSAPDYFTTGEEPPSGAEPGALCAAFDCGASADRVAAILSQCGDEGFVFETERHEALVEALAMPSCAVGFGYAYLARGEMPQGLTDADLTRTE